MDINELLTLYNISPGIAMQFLEQKKIERGYGYGFADRKDRIITSIASLKALMDYFKLSADFDLKSWDGKELPKEFKKISKLACLISEEFFVYFKAPEVKEDTTKIVKQIHKEFQKTKKESKEKQI